MENELLKKPEDFEMYLDTLMSNLEHTIKKEVKQTIKGQKFYAQYTG